MNLTTVVKNGENAAYLRDGELFQSNTPGEALKIQRLNPSLPVPEPI